MRALGMMGLMGRMGRMGRMGLMGPLRLLRPLRLLGLMGLMGTIAACSEAPEASEASEAPFSPASPATPITFSSALADSATVTRSETPLELTAHAFTVFGYKNMTANGNSYGDAQQVFTTGGYRVTWTANSAATTTTNTHDWEYVGQQSAGQEEQTIKYWDWSARAYRFFAVAWPEAATAAEKARGTFASSPTQQSQNPGDPPQTQTYTLSNIDLTSNAILPYISALWFSDGNPATHPERQFGKAVKLVFAQPKSRVRILFKHKDPEGDISAVTLENISFAATDASQKVYQKGTLAVGYPLTGTATRESYSPSVPTPAPADATVSIDTPWTTANEQWYTVLPATGQGAYKLTVTIDADDEPSTAYVPAEYMDWLPGYEYTYIFKVSGSSTIVDYDMVVQAAFTPWILAGEHNHEVYNW